MLSNFINKEPISLGHFGNCLSLTNLEAPDLGNLTFDGQYCLTTFQPRLNSQNNQTDFGFEFMRNESKNYFEQIGQSWIDSRGLAIQGICVPSLCDKMEIQMLIEKCKFIGLRWLRFIFLKLNFIFLYFRF